MSVIHYSAEELGNVAAAFANERMPGTDRRDKALEWLTEALAEVSEGNTKAANVTRSAGRELRPEHRASASSQDRIRLEAMKRLDDYSFDVDAALRTASGFRYNLISNGGTDFAPASLADVLSEALHISMKRGEPNRRPGDMAGVNVR